MRPSLLALMVCVFGVTTGEFVIAGILPGVAHDLGVSIPAAGLLVTAYAIGMIVGGPTLTALTTRFARKRLAVALLAVAVAGNLASAAAPAYGVLFAARVGTALVTSTFFANAVVIATSSAPPDRQASTVARLAFGMNLAMILGAPAGTLIGNELGWRSTFVAIAFACAAGLLLVLRLVPEQERGAAPRSAVAELAVFRNRNVQLAIAVTAVGNAGLLAVFTYLAPLLTDVAGFAAGSVAGLVLVYGVGATVGNLAGGWLSDRAPRRTQLGLLTTLATVFAGCWFIGANPPLTAVAVFLVGAVGFAIVPGMQSRVLSTASAAPTLAIAVNASAFQVAAAAAGWLGGTVVDAAGPRAVYLAAAVVTAAGIAVSGYAWTRAGRTARVPEPTV